MATFKNLEGNRYGKLLVLSRADNKGRKVCWKCLCDCGNERIVPASKLNEGITVSCVECGRKRQADAIKKHGDYKDNLYAVWVSMRQRCNNPHAQEYSNYGGRGIEVCELWNNDYLSFKKWALDNGYSKGLSIERIDVNGNYEPDNCNWITLTKQAFNKRSNHLITFNGVTKTVTEMAMDYGFRPCVILRRLSRGWTIEKALLTPLQTEKIHS